MVSTSVCSMRHLKLDVNEEFNGQDESDGLLFFYDMLKSDESEFCQCW